MVLDTTPRRITTIIMLANIYGVFTMCQELLGTLQVQTHFMLATRPGDAVTPISGIRKLVHNQAHPEAEH